MSAFAMKTPTEGKQAGIPHEESWGESRDLRQPNTALAESREEVPGTEGNA
jgi:hypothetical protein